MFQFIAARRRTVVPHPPAMIDWSDRYPHEDARTIAFRQSTICHQCGRQKEIGKLTCDAHQ